MTELVLLEQKLYFQMLQDQPSMLHASLTMTIKKINAYIYTCEKLK